MMFKPLGHHYYQGVRPYGVRSRCFVRENANLGKGQIGLAIGIRRDSINDCTRDCDASRPICHSNRMAAAFLDCEKSWCDF